MSASDSIRDQLAAGTAALQIALPAVAVDQLVDYVALLGKWNKVYNLTAIREPRQMVNQHLFDSLAVLPYVRGPRLLDVGSGAGLPGLVLGIANPELHCTLLDSSGKKTRFLTQAVIELKLTNIEVVQSRIEDYRPAMLFDDIVSRAFADLTTFVSLAAPLLAEGGRLLAMKGARAAREVEAMPEGWRVATHSLSVPQLDATRELVIAERVS